MQGHITTECGIRPEPRTSELESLTPNYIASTQMLRSSLLIQNTHYEVELVRPPALNHNPTSITITCKHHILTSKQGFQGLLLMITKEDYLKVL